MDLVTVTIPQPDADIIWMAKGHYFDVQCPSMDQMLEYFKIEDAELLKHLSGIVARVILDNDDPKKLFQDALMFGVSSLNSKLEKLDENVGYSKKVIRQIYTEHWVKFMMVVLAGWILPDNWILPAPSWDPDKFKKKKKGD